MPVCDLCGYVNIVKDHFYANKFHIIWPISTISNRNQNLRCQSVRHSDPGVFNSAAFQLQICDSQDHLDLEDIVAWKLLDLRYVQQVKLKQLPAFYSDRDPRLATFRGHIHKFIDILRQIMVARWSHEKTHRTSHHGIIILDTDESVAQSDSKRRRTVQLPLTFLLPGRILDESQSTSCHVDLQRTWWLGNDKTRALRRVNIDLHVYQTWTLVAW